MRAESSEDSPTRKLIAPKKENRLDSRLISTQEKFNSIGLETARMNSADGALLVLPSQGRVIGLWPNCDHDSALWTNQDFHADAVWPNPGGDRIWMAPEREFFIEDLENVDETYKVPSVLDPGCYSFRAAENAVVMENAGCIQALQSGVPVNFKLTRSITPLLDGEIDLIDRSGLVRASGYREQTIIEVDENCPIAVGFWNIIQVPQNGQVMLLHSPDGEYISFFGDPGGAVNRAENGSFMVDFGASASFKIGFTVHGVAGTVAYIRECGDGNSTLLIRGFPVDPDAGYVDTPFTCPESEGSVFQLYFGGRINPFGELEYHSPAVGGDSGRSRYAGDCFVRAFEGPTREIDRIFAQMRSAGIS